MGDGSNPEPNQALADWRVPYEFAVRAIVGVLIFAVVAAFAVGLSYCVRLLGVRNVDKVVIGGLKFCEYLLFAADIILFILFIARDVIKNAQSLVSPKYATTAARAAEPVVKSYFQPVRRAVDPPSSFEPLRKPVAHPPGLREPIVLSYLALRRAVGIVALGLPFVVAIPWWFFAGHVLESSISAYYYTGMRNVFVGSLCAIAMFQLCCRGYDLRDEIAGVFSAFCALGVAFFPTTPDFSPTPLEHHIATVHYACAALLFLTLAYFCLVLFKMTADGKTPTRQKLQRNRVYTVCGWVILASILIIFVLRFLNISAFNVPLLGAVGIVFTFETTSLLAFGTAWLTKSEALLKDE